MWSEGDTLWEEKEFQLFRVYFVIFTSSCSVAVWTTHKSVTLTLLFPPILGSHFPMRSDLALCSYNSFCIRLRKLVFPAQHWSCPLSKALSSVSPEFFLQWKLRADKIWSHLWTLHRLSLCSPYSLLSMKQPIYKRRKATLLTIISTSPLLYTRRAIFYSDCGWAMYTSLPMGQSNKSNKNNKAIKIEKNRVY